MFTSTLCTGPISYLAILSLPSELAGSRTETECFINIRRFEGASLCYYTNRGWEFRKKHAPTKMTPMSEILSRIHLLFMTPISPDSFFGLSKGSSSQKIIFCVFLVVVAVFLLGLRLLPQNWDFTLLFILVHFLRYWILGFHWEFCLIENLKGLVYEG